MTSPLHPRIYLGLGANLGDPIAQLQQAAAELIERRILLPPFRKSSLYRSPPWGPVADQPWFINAVVGGQTALAPLDLLRALKTLECDMGRSVDAVRYGPRMMDLDIVLYDRLVLRAPELTIPHPQIASRAFVLLPLLELAPNLTDPVTHRPYTDFLPPLAAESRLIQKLPDAW